MTPTVADTCVLCGNKATLRCEHIEQDGTTSPTAYCSKDCQVTDWPKHKAACNAAKYRKQLYRAGKVIQDIFFGFREVLYDIPIAKVKKTSDGKLHLYEGKKVKGDIMARFPADLSLEVKDKQAVLSYNACDEALIHMHGLFKAGLAGICTKFEEVTLEHAEYRHRIVFHHVVEPSTGNGPPQHKIINTVKCPGSILLATLKDGKTYVVDLAGAQYGQYRAVMPYADYCASNVLKEDVFGYHFKRREDQIQGKVAPFKPCCHDQVMMHLTFTQINIDGQLPTTKPRGDAKSFMVLEFAARLLMLELEIWETKNKMPFAKLLKEKPPAYSALTADLVEVIRKKMVWCMDKGERKERKFDSTINPQPFHVRVDGGSLNPAMLDMLKNMSVKGDHPDLAKKPGESEKDWAERLNATKTGGWDDGIKIAVGEDAERILADKDKMAELAATGGSVFEF